MGKTRLQFDVTDETLQELNELQSSTGASTRAELLRNALRLYGWFMAQREAGYAVYTKKNEKVEKIHLL